MTIKFKTNIAGYELHLTAAQVEKLTAVLKGAEVVETQWRGSGKGFYGSDQQYDATFVTFSASKHLSPLALINQEEVDKYKTIIAMRENQIVEE